MTVAHGQRTGMLSFTIGNGIAQAAALMRYMIIARVLGPEQLGYAAMLILVSQFFDQLTDAGLDRFLIQSRHGNSRSVNATVHGALIGRGLLIGAAIALSSGMVADFFHQPLMRHGLLLLALAPAINGFAHYDYRRVQRHHSFALEGRMTSASEIVSLFTIVVVALVTHSFVAVAWSLIARGVTAVVMSHLIARRPYRVGYDRRHIPAMAAFGLPLMANGVLLFVAGQGDRLFIGNQLGARELGHYSAVILLIFYPATMLSRLVQSVNLPVIAAARADANLGRRLIDRLAAQAVVLAVAMALGFAVVAPFAVPLIYGKHFVLPALLFALIGVLQGTRFIRLWPVTVALAAGTSRVLLVNSIARLVAFPLAFLLVRVLGGLAGVVVAFIIAEFISFAVSLLQLHAKGLGLPRRDWNRLALMLGVFAATIALVWALGVGAMATIVGAAIALTGLLAVLCLTERAVIPGMIALPLSPIRRLLTRNR